MSLVDFAPILDALEALAIFAILVAASTPLAPVINCVIQVKSRSIVRVEIKSNQK